MSRSLNSDHMWSVHPSRSRSWIAVASNLLERLIRKLIVRNGIAELSAMDDRLLADSASLANRSSTWRSIGGSQHRSN